MALFLVVAAPAVPSVPVLALLVPGTDRCVGDVPQRLLWFGLCNGRGGHGVDGHSYVLVGSIEHHGGRERGREIFLTRSDTLEIR